LLVENLDSTEFIPLALQLSRTIFNVNNDETGIENSHYKNEGFCSTLLFYKLKYITSNISILGYRQLYSKLYNKMIVEQLTTTPACMSPLCCYNLLI
jgi:hypothetical protein